jgi:hypothetical protein
LPEPESFRKRKLIRERAFIRLPPDADGTDGFRKNIYKKKLRKRAVVSGNGTPPLPRSTERAADMLNLHRYRGESADELIAKYELGVVPLHYTVAAGSIPPPETTEPRSTAGFL